MIPAADQGIREVILHDKDCPLNIYLNHSQKNQGEIRITSDQNENICFELESIIFKVMKCPPQYMQIRQQLQTQDRILHDHLPMLIEVNRGKKILRYSFNLNSP